MVILFPNFEYSGNAAKLVPAQESVRLGAPLGICVPGSGDI